MTFINKRSNVLALGLSVLSFVFWAIILSYKYYHFGYHDWDLAFFAQSAWSLLHGSQHSSLVGINFFGDHSYFFVFFILPVYFIWPHPLTLVALKVFSYSAGAYLFFKILKKDLGPTVSLTLMFLYLIFPANAFSLLYEFNPEGFAPLLIFLVFYYFKENKLIPFYISSIFLMLIKENLISIIFVFGFLAFFFKQKQRFSWSFVPITVSILLFFVFSSLLIPHFRELPIHPFWVRYRHLGITLADETGRLIIDFSQLTSALFNSQNMSYILELFGPLIVFAVFSPAIVFLCCPIILQHLLSRHWPEHTIYFHYGASIAPIIFLAAANTYQKYRRIFSVGRIQAIIALLTIVSLTHTASYIPKFLQSIDYHKGNLVSERWRLIKEIPKDGGVIATFDFLAELSQRRHLYSFHMIYDDFFQDPNVIVYSELYTGKIFHLPDDATYALIDFNDTWFRDSYATQPRITYRRIADLFRKNEWRIIDSAGETFLLKRGSENGEIFTEQKLFSIFQSLN